MYDIYLLVKTDQDLCKSEGTVQHVFPGADLEDQKILNISTVSS